LTIQGCGNILVAARLEYFHTLPSKSASIILSMFCVMHIHEAFPAVREEFSFRKTICTLSRNMSDMIDEGDISDILLLQYFMS
jgi:hypothetical protein